MTNFTTITDNADNAQRIDYGWRDNGAIRDIGRYRHLLLDIGVAGRVLATYAVAIELIGERSYICSFEIESGSAPAPVRDHMEEIAKGHAVNLGCGHC